mmetsp:Transcript_8546/g.26745  ORF Transcript_8546/g.26745 Transcript_8546/m.26745 type:complete len:88 (-) Transcript_8546:357-620(-)
MVAGHPPSDRASLLAAVEEAALPVDEAAQVLDSTSYADAVRAELDSARRADVRGVPAFFHDGTLLTSGAIPTDAWIDELARIARTAA